MIDDPASLEVSVVVPVYGSAPIVPALVARTSAALTSGAPARSFELVLVCDASPDDSWQAIQREAAADPRVRGVLLRRNAGQHNATMAGLHHARGARIVVMDDDLQHPPEAIPLTASPARRGLRRLLHALSAIASTVVEAIRQRRERSRGARAAGQAGQGLYLSSFKALQRDGRARSVALRRPVRVRRRLDPRRHASHHDRRHRARRAPCGRGQLHARRRLRCGSRWRRASRCIRCVSWLPADSSSRS